MSSSVANADAFTGRDWALFASVSLIWGASFLLIAEALEAFTPGVVTLGRVGFGAITLMALRPFVAPDLRIDPEDRRDVAVLAVTWVALPFTLFPIAQQWINSAVAGLLNGATPVFVALFSIVLFRVAPRRVQAVGLAVGFLGLTLVSAGSASTGPAQLRGVVVALGAAVCYGIAINLAQPLQAKYGAVVLMGNALAFATLLCIPYAFVDLGENDWQLAPAAALVALGCLGTGVAYWIMITLVGSVGSIRASFITYLIPVVSLALGVWLRGDDVAALALLGAPLTIVGAILAGRRAN